VLVNVVPHGLDTSWNHHHGRLGVLVPYADDLLIAPYKERAKAMLNHQGVPQARMADPRARGTRHALEG
jgi:hypothetical protein